MEHGKKAVKHIDHAAHSTHSSSDSIEIPIGKWMHAVKSNGWVAATLLLAIFSIVLVIIHVRGGTSSATSTGDEAAQALISFITQQGSDATLVSVMQEGALYKVTLSIDGQTAPIYVTLDGKYAVPQPIPIDGSAPAGGTTPPRGTTPPSSDPVTVDIAGSPVLGQANAPVTIVEFSDYQCPFCRKFWSDAYTQLKTDYIATGKVKLVFKDYPLDFHPMALKTAEAVRCVRDQKKDAGYFAFHDKVFEEQMKLDGGTVKSTVTYTIDDLKKWAKELGGINMVTFASCLDSGKYTEAVKADQVYGQQLGISGTPGFFINGRVLEGAQPFAAFKRLIDAELAA
ncbi:hypothetical protein EXS73_02015 [Candidatus Pacearchaeota archaeon]|nr:hypothetical protein [Candidatus Pacearchaeota archaeon]